MTSLETPGGEGPLPVAEMIVPWAGVLPGDQVLDEGRLITVDDIRVCPQDGHPDFLIAYASGYTEDGRGVHVSPPAASLTAVRRPVGPGHVTVSKADLDVLVACCTSYLPPDVTPGVTEALGRLLGAWEAAGGDGPRCPDCGVPLSMHHDPGCGQPCGACEAPKAVATVTVTAPDGAEITYAASEIQPAPDGYLRLYAGGKTILAVAPGGWVSAEEDGHRAPGAPDHAARTAAVEAAIGEISEAAGDPGDSPRAQLDRINDILDRLAAGS